MRRRKRGLEEFGREGYVRIEKKQTTRGSNTRGAVKLERGRGGREIGNKGGCVDTKNGVLLFSQPWGSGSLGIVVMI